MYHPEEWQLVKITGQHPHYRVFASWRGGYTTGDSWKLNSGVVSVTEDEDFYYFNGHSGSVYQCHKKCYGVRSMYNRSVIGEYVDKSGGKMELIEEMPDVMNMNWDIKGEADE